MIKILKEIFKSLSKSKILIGCLSFLVFLSSGIFTLLFDIKTTYNNQFNDYKKVSKLQDLTVDLEMKAHGRKPENIYNEKTDSNNYYLEANANNQTKTKIKIPETDIYGELKTDPNGNKINEKKFIKASDVFASINPGADDFYILAPEFYEFLNINSGIEEYLNGITNFEFEKTEIPNKKFREFNFRKYLSPTETGNAITLELKNTDLVFQKFLNLQNNPYKLSDLVTIIKGSKPGILTSGSSDKITNVKNIYVNMSTKESSLAVEKKRLWEKEGTLFVISAPKVAHLLGFQIDPSSSNTYIEDKKLAQNLLFLPKKPGKYLRLDPEAKIISSANLSINSTYPLLVEKRISQQIGFFTLTNNPSTAAKLKIKNLWIKKTQILNIYKETNYLLNYDFNDGAQNNQWSGSYKEFLDNLNSIQRQKYENISYWSKYRYLNEINLNQSNSQTIPNISIEQINKSSSQDLITSDMNIALEQFWPSNKITKQNSNLTTIAQKSRKNKIFNNKEYLNLIQDFSNNKPFSILAKTLLARINNSSIKANKTSEILERVESKTKTVVYKKIRELVKDNTSTNMGIRENLTVASINANENKLFHFVNAGDENGQIKFGQKYINQDVGKLYAEEKNQKSSMLFNYKNSFDPKSELILKQYTPYIIEKLFKGYSTNYDYLNPIFYYGNYSYQNKRYTNQRIILLTDSNGAKFGINFNNDFKKYIFLNPAQQSPFLEWSENKEYRPILNIKELVQIFEKHGFEFAKKDLKNRTIKLIGDNGWAVNDTNYTNKFYVPFQMIIPASALVNNDAAPDDKFHYFSENLIKNIAPLLDKIIDPRNVRRLLNAINRAFSKYGFEKVLVPPAEISRFALEKTIVGVLYETAIVDNIDDTLGDILSDIFKALKTSGINKNLKSIEWILLQFFGLKIDLNKLANDYFSSADELVSSIQAIIETIDVDAVIIEIFKFYEQTNSSDYRNIGFGDIFPKILENINETGFKTALGVFVGKIKFANVFKQLKANLSPEELKLYGNIIDQLNANIDPAINKSDYYNVNTGLQKIVELLNIQKLKENIEKNSKNITEEIINLDNKPINITTNTISISALLASLLVSTVSDSNEQNLFIDALIELANLSSKTKWEGLGNIGVAQPDSDPYKIDLFDLQKMNVSKSKEIASDNDVLLETIKLIQSGQRDLLSIKHLQKLNEYVLLDKEKLSNFSDSELIARISKITRFLAQLALTNSDTTTADNFLALIDPSRKNWNANIVKNFITKLIYEQFFKQKPLTYDMLPEILNFYSFWLQFAKAAIENNLNPKEEIQQLIDSVTTNVELNNILSTSSESFTSFDNIIPGLISWNPILYDGFTNARKVANKLALFATKITNKNLANPNKSWLPIEMLDRFFDFKKDYDTNGKLLSVTYEVSEKTFALVSALSFLVANSSQIKPLLIKNFSNLFLSTTNPEENLINIELALKMQKKINGSTFTTLDSLGLSSSIMSVFSAVLNPGIMLWYTVNENKNSNLGNIAYILKTKLDLINSSDPNDFPIKLNGLTKVFENIIGQQFLKASSYNPKEKIPFALSVEEIRNIYYKFLKEDQNGNYLKDPQGNYVDEELFGISVNDLISNAIDSFIEIRAEKNEIVAYNPGSYYAKVNSAFMRKNNKQTYVFKSNSEIPTNSAQMNDLLNAIDSKYKINVNGLEFLLIGEDSTADYLYPVINAQNLQVDTENQAIVYVNQLGFDRVRESNASAFVDRYFLVRKGNFKGTIKELADQINLLIYNETNGTNESEFNPDTMGKFAYLYNESNPLKLERSIRVGRVEQIINSINTINLIISIILTILIGIIIIFIIRRYVASKSTVFGILKAQGYSRIQIALSVCIITLIIATIGGMFGYIAGHFLQIPIMNVFSNYWTLPTTTLPFNIWSLAITMFLPFVAMSLLAVFVAFSFLRLKSTSLIERSFELNQSKFAIKINNMTRNTSVKNKFSINLALNSIWKLVSLFFALLVTSTISIFAFSTNNIFNKAAHISYQNKKYNYKVDLATPTIEGGTYQKVDVTNLENKLYVPLGNLNESSTYLGDYFKPGYSQVIDQGGKNGNLNSLDAHIITKNSLDLNVQSAGINLNVWNTLFNSLPEAQKKQLLDLSQQVSPLLELYQDNIKIYNHDQTNEYALNIKTKQKTNYFKYIKNKEIHLSHFVKRKYNPQTDSYINQKITIGGKTNSETQINNLRDEYRAFLVSAYQKLAVDPNAIQDYYLIFGGVDYKADVNEDYSWAKAIFNYDGKNSEEKIYGYKLDSKFIKIYDNQGNNLLEKANSYAQSNSKYLPLIINEVSAKLYNLKKGSKISLDIINTKDRNVDKLLSKMDKANTSRKKVDFEIIGITNTYINKEWITTQDVINKILSFDKNEFNGLFSNKNDPSIISNSLSLYSQSGYWAADHLIQTNYSAEAESADSGFLKTNQDIFKELFYKIKNNKNVSVMAQSLQKINPEYFKSEANVENAICKFLEIELNDLKNPNPNPNLVKNALSAFTEVYGSEILSPMLKTVNSKSIESGFASQTSETINTISILILVISLIISITILILISTLIINENEKAIAIFGILGYSLKDKARMFLTIYFPILIIAILLSIPLAMGLSSIFVASILSSTMMALPLSIGILDILFSSILILIVFSFSLFVAWYTINKVKPIMLLNKN